MRRRGFAVDDYARLHPGGALGRKTLPVSAVMRTGEAVARAGADQTVREVLFAITKARAGAAIVLDAAGRVVGIFCDGDLRRGLERDGAFLSRPVAEVMTRDCVRIAADVRAGEALDILRERRIGEAPVIDEDGRLLGVADLKSIVASI
jgi:arabinose-5-phosphate isomerase